VDQVPRKRNSSQANGRGKAGKDVPELSESMLLLLSRFSQAFSLDGEAEEVFGWAVNAGYPDERIATAVDYAIHQNPDRPCGYLRRALEKYGEWHVDEWACKSQGRTAGGNGQPGTPPPRVGRVPAPTGKYANAGASS